MRALWIRSPTFGPCSPCACAADAIARCGSFTFEAQFRRLDGALRWMRISADVACRDGRATHLYGLKQDITREMTS